MFGYVSVHAFDGWFDAMLPNLCEGKSAGEDMGIPTSPAGQPQIFPSTCPERGGVYRV